MKIAAGILMFVVLGIGVNAQQAAGGSKMMVETSVLSEKIVKGSPFSADAVNESVQVLADGNRIVHSSTNKLYRNSEGRFRREISGGSGGSLGAFYSVGPGITILDPVMNQRFMIDSELRTARIATLNGVAAIAPTARVLPAQAVRALSAEDKLNAELKAVGQGTVTVTAAAPSKDFKALADQARAMEEHVKVYADTVRAAQGSTFVYTPAAPSKTKYETRNEDLGVQNIEGVEATGTRTVTTIPAGAIGNERPIEIVYERWYSNELQLVVMSKNSDPRFGEQTYRLTNIVRNEPDPSLFELPQGYKVLSEPGGGYTISPTGKGGTQNVTYSRPPAPPTAPTVKATRP